MHTCMKGPRTYKIARILGQSSVPIPLCGWSGGSSPVCMYTCSVFRRVLLDQRQVQDASSLACFIIVGLIIICHSGQRGVYHTALVVDKHHSTAVSLHYLCILHIPQGFVYSELHTPSTCAVGVYHD